MAIIIIIIIIMKYITYRHFTTVFEEIIVVENLFYFHFYHSDQFVYQLEWFLNKTHSNKWLIHKSDITITCDKSNSDKGTTFLANKYLTVEHKSLFNKDKYNLFVHHLSQYT